ncbi:MAG: hypothetical protein WKF37_24125 [Bryobacteraceae bacterium]
MRALATFAWFALTLTGTDLSGTWVGQIARGNGEFQDVAFRFTQSGSKLTGKLYGDFGSNPISEARVSGELLTFVVITAEQSGNQINDTRLRFAGRGHNGEIELVRERETATIAGNGGDVSLGNKAKQIFRLKRLL